MSEAIPIPVGWKIIVKPKQGKTTTESGLDISAGKAAEEHLNYIAEIVAMGEAAFKAKTKSGIDMSAWAARPEVGDYIVYSPYSGQQIRRVGKGVVNLLLLNDTDVHALIDNPDDYYAWIDA